MRYSSPKGRSADVAALTLRCTSSRSPGWMMLPNVRRALLTKSAAGYPEIRSISSLITAIVQSASSAQR